MRINWKHVAAHLAFWFLYIIIWGIRDLAFAPTFWDTLDGNVIGSIWYAFGVYVNLFLLVPKLLLKRRKWGYLLSITLLTLIISYGLAKTFEWHYLSIHLGTSEFFGSVQGVANTASDFLVVFVLATCLYFINEWYIKERKLRALESQNLKAELNLLKGQINPHFLFNALNSVHVLIRTNPGLASDTLEKFSDLLSHQLYDIKKDQVSLSDEVQNLDNFIAIQKMRHQDHVVVDWKYQGDLTGKHISPMLFLNFVENAFKHGDTADENGLSTIKIALKIAGNDLEFSCINSISSINANERSNGLGLENVRRRLELIYPNRYMLNVERNDKSYTVHLKLSLNEN